jgi:hypothetical protein
MAAGMSKGFPCVHKNKGSEKLNRKGVVYGEDKWETRRKTRGADKRIMNKKKWQTRTPEIFLSATLN